MSSNINNLESIPKFETLLPGVIIAFQGINFPQDRLKLSSGTIDAISTLENPYFQGAKVPKLPWRKITSLEYDILTKASTQRLRGESVTILSLDNQTLDPLQEFNLKMRNTLEDYYEIYKLPRFKLVLENLLAQLSWLSPVRSDRNMVLAMSVSYPDLYTVATDYINHTQPNGDRAFIGLHFDTTSEEVLVRDEERIDAKNRICINIGKGDRHLLFINQTATTILNALNPFGNDTTLNLSTTRQSSRDFMNKFPNYPVIRITLKPGEAYIAPTDNIIHDGSSEMSLHPDISLHFLGDFDLPLASN
jgi:hypothetical protein